MLTLRCGDQEEIILTKSITDVFIWIYSALYVVIACPLPELN
jgi:hypothetical protein